MALLEVRNVSVRFGGHHALEDVNHDAKHGEITAQIGPNGAGKTTLFNAMCGLLTPNSGSIKLDGRELTRLRPFKRARLGLARTFQRLELWGLLTVRENVMVAADLRARYKRDGTKPRDDVAHIIERVGLLDLIDVRVDELPTGQARLVEIARALATRPRILLLDEPASGLDETESAQLGVLLGQLAGEGMGILLVEHDVRLVMDVSHLIHVLDFGHIIATGNAEEIRTNDAVLAAYLGSSLEPGA
jgi:branched-chain amino acid transport system ATP-binding protein